LNRPSIGMGKWNMMGIFHRPSWGCFVSPDINYG
jgi:hypothetical protein